jgi:CRP/FNR family transcriptional regulator, cyclic AMP receptor protein
MIDDAQIEDEVAAIRSTLQRLPLKAGESEQLESLLRLSTVRKYAPGETIIEEGERDPWVYLLLSGSLAIHREGTEIGRIDGPGEIFGEMRLLDGRGRSATVIAESATVCLAVNLAASTHGLSSDERAGALLLLYRIFTEYLATRLRIANDELARLRKAPDPDP